MSEETNPFDAFPDGVREDVEGLIWLGYLEDQFDFCGHNFVLRTLRGDEELLAGIVTKEFKETLAEARAFSWAQVALALVSVDGDRDFCPPIGPDKTEYARARFRYCTKKWYWPLGQYLYGRYVQLLERQLVAIKAVQDLSTGDLSTFMPYADSLTDKGDSTPDEPEEDIRTYLEDPQD